MSQPIALAAGMTGIFYGFSVARAAQRAEITRVWSDTCVNLRLLAGNGFSEAEATSVFVPPLGTPAERHPAGWYFLPDAFVAALMSEEEVDRLEATDLADSTGTEGIVAAHPDRPMSFGERAVGLQFNPSNQTAVYQCKSKYASLIDQLEARRQSTTDGELARLCSIAITEAQTAQMWAVKALTWNS